MWTCPKCGRSFKKENQQHYCGEKPATIAEYIAAQEESVRPALLQVYAALKDALPDAAERISWSMPTFWQGHNIIHFAANKHHIGLYPGTEAVEYFAEALKLKGYSYSKGSIQIPYREPLPLELIAAIAAWCAATGNHP